MTNTSDPAQTAAALGITDETPDINEETFDLDEWIDGVEATVRSVRIYRRADLIGEIEDLQSRHALAKQIPSEERGLTDESPDAIMEQLIAKAEEFNRSVLVIKVRGQSRDVVDAAIKRGKKAGVDEADVQLQLIADAIISPKGVTPALLRKLGERNAPELDKVKVAWTFAVYQPSNSAEAVNAPLSQSSSGAQRTRAR
jgi:hypothetical protein